MKVRVISDASFPTFSWWVYVIVGVWLALVAIAVWLSSHYGYHVELCLFRRITGIPCPTCGATRGTLCVLQGHVRCGFMYNPLLFTSAMLFVVYHGLRCVTGKRVCINMHRWERRLLWSIVGFLVGLNWLYLIVFTN